MDLELKKLIEEEIKKEDGLIDKGDIELAKKLFIYQGETFPYPEETFFEFLERLIYLVAEYFSYPISDLI